MHRVSVIIPCYNGGAFLREAVESTCALGKAVREIIIVDDGSTDAMTISEITRFEAAGCSVLRQTNRGLAAARNAGIRIATSEYIIPLDCDNRLRAPYIIRGLEILERDGAVGVVYSDAEFFGERKGLWRVDEFDLRSLVESNFIDACALFRRCLWEQLEGYDEHMPWMGWEDWDFWLRAALRGWEFRHLVEVGFDYRVRGDSMLATTTKHSEELRGYIFAKRELRAARLIREMGREIKELKLITGSRGSRLGRRVFDELKRARQIFHFLE